MLLTQIQWNVDPSILKFGSFEVRWYGLLFAASFLIGFQIMTHIFKKENKPEKDLDALLMTMILSTVLGARIGHFAFYEPEIFTTKPWTIFIPPFAGLASHGALVGILIGLWLFFRKHSDYTFLWLTDRIVILVALAGCFIRLGNLMNHEIIGKPTNVPWAFTFLQNYEFSQVPRHPTQLYESLSCLFIFFVLCFLWNHWKEKTPQGLLVGLFLVWVFGLRFVYEFFKENQVNFENTMTYNMGQILSIPAVLLGIFLLVRAKKPVE